MKKLILAISIIVAGVASLCCAQTPGTVTTGPGNTAGLLYASNFGLWQVPQGNTGQFSWSSPSFCTVTAAGIPLAPVFAVGTPVFIKDQLSANSETVTPSAVNVGGAGCSLTVSPANHHNTFILASGTAGLQESINYAHGLPYQVILTPDWTRLGGTTGMITAAKGNSNVQISDQRGACITAYIWSGSAYAAQTSSCSGGGVTSINSQTGPAITLQSSGGTVAITNPSPNTINMESIGGGVSQIIAGTNVTVSPSGGTGAVTIDATGGGSGGVQYNPPNTVYMWGAGDSSISDDGRLYGGSTTATAANCNGTVCIITAPNSYAAGQTIWIDGTWSPSFLNTVTAPQYLGTGHGFYQVISTGLSSTQFEFTYTSASGTGTGGTVRDTSYMVPFLSGSMPFLNGHGTTIVEAGQESGQGFSIQASLDNFSALYGSYAPNVTGNPGFFFISGWKNDVGVLNESASTVVSNIQSLMALAHASGWQVVAMTEWTSVGGTNMALSYMAQINSDILQLGKTNANASSGQYWDYIVDAASGVTDTGNTYTPSTVPLIAAKVNEAFASQKAATTGLSTMFSLDTGPDIWRMQGNNGLEICTVNNAYPACMLTVAANGNTTSVNNFDETQTAGVNDRGGTGIGSPILVSNPSSYYPTGVTEYFPSLSAGQYGSMLYAFDQIGDHFSLHLENTGSASIFGISGSQESPSTPTDILQVFANGNVAIPAEAPFAGYAACFTTGGTMGHCTSIIGATGTCTCVTP